MNTEEISVAVPWGHVAGIAWGDKNNPHVLTFHGIQDNAGSFSALIPKLPTSYYYLCFDLPGHGKSSHFPPHLPIHSSDYIIVYKLIAQRFGKNKYIIMGHSYGGQIALLFAQLYPQYVGKLIMLDTIHLMPIPSTLFQSNTAEKFDTMIELYTKLASGKRPSYTYEEALDKVLNQRHYGELTEESAKNLLKRGLEAADDDRFYFTMDQRVKFFMNPIHDFRYIIETLNKAPVRCKVLIILGKDSSYQQVYMRPILKVFEKNRNVYIKQVPGHHDVHMNDPDLVAKYVTKFLTQTDSKL